MHKKQPIIYIKLIYFSADFEPDLIYKHQIAYPLPLDEVSIFYALMLIKLQSHHLLRGALGM